MNTFKIRYEKWNKKPLAHGNVIIPCFAKQIPWTLSSSAFMLPTPLNLCNYSIVKKYLQTKNLYFFLWYWYITSVFFNPGIHSENSGNNCSRPDDEMWKRNTCIRQAPSLRRSEERMARRRSPRHREPKRNRIYPCIFHVFPWIRKRISWAS